MCLQTDATSSSKAIRYDECCCSGHGAGWGDGRREKYQAIECKSCPDINSPEFKAMCPAGIGYDKNGDVIDDCSVVPHACEVNHTFLLQTVFKFKLHIFGGVFLTSAY